MNFDEALALVYEAFKEVFKRKPCSPLEKVVCCRDQISKIIKEKTGVEPICTNSSTMRDVALSIVDALV